MKDSKSSTLLIVTVSILIELSIADVVDVDVAMVAEPAKLLANADVKSPPLESVKAFAF